jgi:hypothetical protein
LISAGVCAIIKGVYLLQLRQQDFYFHGKDVTIWTVVETATAIIAASIPVLRVFFKEAVSSYNHSHGRSNGGRSNARTVPLSNLSRSHRSSHTATIQSMGKGREDGWTTLEPIEDGIEDASSQRSILRDEEHGSEKSKPQVDIKHKGIMQTNTVTVTSDVDSKSMHKGRSWLGAPKE